jgi:hypothetical protein
MNEYVRVCLFFFTQSTVRYKNDLRHAVYQLFIVFYRQLGRVKGAHREKKRNEQKRKEQKRK